MQHDATETMSVMQTPQMERRGGSLSLLVFFSSKCLHFAQVGSGNPLIAQWHLELWVFHLELVPVLPWPATVVCSDREHCSIDGMNHFSEWSMNRQATDGNDYLWLVIDDIMVRQCLMANDG